MSLETAAKRLAAKGRKGDSLLVHMHPREVAGLQALALKSGTTMTINPETGLPEAFGLKNILPMVAGAVGGYFGGPWGGAAASALTTKAMGGSDRGALMSGLGGYMGTGAMGSAAGEAAAEGAAAEGLAGAAGEGLAAGEGAVQLSGPGTELLQSPEGGWYNPAGSETTVIQPAAPVPAAAVEAPVQLGGPRDTTMGQDFAAWREKMGSGLGRVGLGAMMQAQSVPPEAPEKRKIPGGIQHYTFDPAQQGGVPVDSRERKQLGNIFTRGAYEDRTRYMAKGGIARLAGGGDAASAPVVAMPASVTGGYNPEQVYGPGQSGGYDPRGTYGAGATTGPWVPPQAAAQAAAPSSQMYTYDPSTSSFTWNPAFTGTGYTDPTGATQSNFAKHADVVLKEKAGQMGVPGQAVDFIHAGLDPIGVFGFGGWAKGGSIPGSGQGQGSSLGSFSDGGQLLRGPGDGVSDDIPATIDGQRPARLATNEFVIPARIVSELGNGSTEAGSKKLYDMLDRIQQARSKTMGKGKMAVDSKADRHLPA